MRIAVITLAAALGALTASAETAPSDIRGGWTTPLAEQPAPSGEASAYVRERIEFTEDTNTILVEVFADPAGEVPLFTYASVGPYRTPGPSAAVPGALELDAENAESIVTIFQDAPDLWRILNFDECPLEVGVAAEISDCVSGPPFNSARCTERDLVRVDGTELRLGARDVDRCAERPTALGEVVYTRE